MSELEGGSSQIAASRECRYHGNFIRIEQNTKREDERSEWLSMFKLEMRRS